MGDTVNLLASASLKRPLDDAPITEQTHVDAAGSTAETVPSNGPSGTHNGVEALESSAKRPKLEGDPSALPRKSDSRDRVRGVAMIKDE